jgi:hypothetical protein
MVALSTGFIFASKPQGLSAIFCGFDPEFEHEFEFDWGNEAGYRRFEKTGDPPKRAATRAARFGRSLSLPP